MSSITQQILTLDKPPPKIILSPPPQVKQQGPQTNQGGNRPESAPSVAASSSSPAAKASPPTRPVDFPNGSNQGYLTERRGSFVASETPQPSPYSAKMRRFDSHSLLSDNSIASSRFDLSEGSSYPEWVYRFVLCPRVFFPPLECWLLTLDVKN